MARPLHAERRGPQVVVYGREAKMRRAVLVILTFGIASTAFARRSEAATFNVANEADLQTAINNAPNNGDASNTIRITTSPIFVSQIIIGDQKGHPLLIAPDTTLARVQIQATSASTPVIDFNHATSVTLQDLDVIRTLTNLGHLVTLENQSANVTIERCRIGFGAATVGNPTNHEVMVMDYPIHVVIRNSILFSDLPGNFDDAIKATMTDQSNSLFLYNDAISGYGKYGVEVDDGASNSVLVFRNDVLVNAAGLSPEPVAFHSTVGQLVNVVSSHNTIFGSPANLEVVTGVQAVAGSGSALRVLGKTLVSGAGGAFVSASWSSSVSDPDYFRLVPGGLLHLDTTSAGATVGNGSPSAFDIAVTDDIEKDPRPNGTPVHTDRGPDQIRTNDVLAASASVPVGPWATLALLAALALVGRARLGRR
jgi:hypothetical protein